MHIIRGMATKSGIPQFKKNAFTCPHCDTFTQQSWQNPHIVEFNGLNVLLDYHVSTCAICEKISIWLYKNKNKNKKQIPYMAYPTINRGPTPEPNMPKNIQKYYNEARKIAALSPRSACTLLRFCVEKICDNKDGKNLNQTIEDLSRRGFDKKIIHAMDVVRVIGNNAAHKLEIQLNDNAKVTTSLFCIVNYISNFIYTREKIIDDIYKSLPPDKKSAIEKRSKRK